MGSLPFFIWLNAKGSLPFHWLHCHEFITDKTGFSAISWVRCLSHGDTLPNTWGHISKYMGTHFQIHGDTLPNIWGHVANTKIYVQHIWGQIAITDEYI